MNKARHGERSMTMSRTKQIRALSALGTIAILACLAAFAVVGSASATVPATGMELEFAGDTATLAAGQVEVPVECVGESTGFCSGALTLTLHGRRSVSTFSVEGGQDETVFVPLPGAGRSRRLQ